MSALALAAAAALSGEGLTGELIAVERSFYEGWKARSVAPLEANLGADAVAFGAFGVIERKAQIDGQAKANPNCTVKAYSLDNPRSLRVSGDAAVLYYTVSQDAVCGGAKVESPLANTSVYARRDGRWVNVFRTFAPVSGPTGKE